MAPSSRDPFHDNCLCLMLARDGNGASKRGNLNLLYLAPSRSLVQFLDIALVVVKIFAHSFSTVLFSPSDISIENVLHE